MVGCRTLQVLQIGRHVERSIQIVGHLGRDQVSEAVSASLFDADGIPIQQDTIAGARPLIMDLTPCGDVLLRIGAPLKVRVRGPQAPRHDGQKDDRAEGLAGTR